MALLRYSVLPIKSPASLALCEQVRNFATLKEISVRLRSVKNIQKITKSMKMVSAAKYARAERELRPARAYGTGAKAFFEKAEIEQDDKQPNHLIVAVSSDRGLCGGIHSSVVKEIKRILADKPDGVSSKIVAIGDKARGMLYRWYGKHLLYTFKEVGKKPPCFADAAVIAQYILHSGYKHDFGQLIYNHYRSVVSYKTTTLPLYPAESVSGAPKLSLYDSVDDEIMQSYNEFALTNLIYFSMMESACSEQSSRMTAMDAASKNAGEMIDKLTLQFNRTRQAVITRELIEIISGAAAV